MANYYINTLTRGAPLLVGMLFGYWLVETREQKIRLQKVLKKVFFVNKKTELRNWFALYGLYWPFQGPNCQLHYAL